MDWFQRWPKDALVAVSSHFISRYDMAATEQVKQSLMQAMGEFQVCDTGISISISLAYRLILFDHSELFSFRVLSVDFSFQVFCFKDEPVMSFLTPLTHNRP